MSLRPLDGFVIGVTADRRWEEQAELLARRGASVLHGPTITTLYLASDDHLRRATAEVMAQPPDYLVATTGIGVRAWLDAAHTWGVADELVAALAGARIVARGPKAAAALQINGLATWELSPTEQMDAVADILLAEPLTERRVAVQEYGAPEPQFAARLAAAGASVVSIPVYRWRIPADPAPALRLIDAACRGEVDAITFTSAPAVHNLFAIAADHGSADVLRAALNGTVAAACVGPVCAAGAVEEGVQAPIAPEVGRLGLLIRALSDHLGGRRRQLRLEDHEVTIQGAAVEIDGEVVALSPLERSLLNLLAQKPGSVVGRRTFLGQVWGSASADDHLLDVAMGRLRRRLGPAAGALQTVPGRGYRLDVAEPPGAGGAHPGRLADPKAGSQPGRPRK
jgi:uroporphyrinogen-III synthase